ncbi:endo alpha-1,4 polygalactosaminidase [Bacillus sp. 2205SS5-2]|uniref:endo alpha-1,4 polygalactosaminidase n=1 Tax=Bacillus sp. 2205SS5-2 TaxID=3109031 RepID=UPI003004198E
MKRVVILFCFLVYTLLSPLAYSPVRAELESPFSQINTYQIYYNTPTDEILENMKDYDLVIVEPHEFTVDQIQQLKDSGTMVLGYINTMEADEWNIEFMNQLHQDDFYYEVDKRVFYPEWNSYLMDISSPHYQELLQQEINNQIIQKGFDGIFLDTVGDIDNEFLDQPDVLEAQRAGMVSFLKTVKEKYPQLPLLQNWGFDTLKEATAPYVDGILWENFDQNVIANDEWAQNTIQTLREMKQEYPLEVFTVSFSEGEWSKAFAEEKGFVHYYEPESFDEFTWNDFATSPTISSENGLAQIREYQVY